MNNFDLTIDFAKKMLSMTTPGGTATVTLQGSGFTDKVARKCAAKIAKVTKAKVETANKDYIILINAENMV